MLPGVGSIRLMWLFEQHPRPGRRDPASRTADCSVCVALTIVPSSSMTVQWVVLVPSALRIPAPIRTGPSVKLAVRRGPAPASRSSPARRCSAYHFEVSSADRHVDAVRVGHVAAAVGERDLQPLGQQVDVARLARTPDRPARSGTPPAG